jgi:HD-GYP domain-containing protein (c-di-GMP phosphodiesterase class II)
VFLRTGGVDEAVAMVRRRRGTQFDPDLADVFCEHSVELAEELADVEPWPTVLSMAPEAIPLTDPELDQGLEAIADFADLKSPFTAGHSRGVADLAAEAGRLMALGAADVQDLRRAGLAHDLGRMGVSNAVWDKATALSDAERERVRLHPYLTERILHRVPGLARIASMAGAHHERLDGSGYSRGLRGVALSMPDRVLAAADAFHTCREHRPHRPAMPEQQAVGRVRTDVREGRLDPVAVDAVMAASGQRLDRRRLRPGGLTAREVEVLRLVTRGLPNRVIATTLSISEKTARNHVEHIYAKIGASNRTGATLFAIRTGMVGWETEP